MRRRTLTILWPSFLMAAVLEGIVFSAIDPDEAPFVHFAGDLSPLGVYTIGFMVFWSVIACASGMTAVLVVEHDDHPPP